MEFLINVPNINEANMLIALLSTYDIPSFYKSKQSGQYLQITSGVSFHGIDIYVPSDLLDKAKDIILQTNKDIILDEDIEIHEVNTKYKKKRRIILNIYLFSIFGFILFYILREILNFL